MNSFDNYGWYSAQEIAERQTAQEPPKCAETPTPGELYPNFTGYEWIMLSYVTPQPMEPPAPEAVPETPAPETRLSYLEFFLGRFTETELWAIEMATEIIGEENRRLRLAMGLMKKAEYISLQDPRTEQFLNELTSAGILAPGRVAEILTA